MDEDEAEHAMNDIANLQQAVETARAANASASEQHARSRKHAMSLIHIVEECLPEKRVELPRNQIQDERMTQEYGQLRQMLHALVKTVEVGASDRLRNGPVEIEVKPEAMTPLGPPAVVTGSSVPRVDKAAYSSLGNGRVARFS